MGAPHTPARPRAIDLSDTLAKTHKPPAPFAPAAAGPARPHLLSSEAALAGPSRPPVISAPAAGAIEKAPSTDSGEGWTLSPEGCIVAVRAPRHVLKLMPYCSWLHQFEHARYLHAGVREGAISWPSYPYRVQDGVEYPHLEEMHDYLAALPGAVSTVRRPDPSLWTEIPYCESKAELQAAFRLGSVHFSGSLTADKERVVFRLAPPAAGMGSSLYRRFGSDRFFRITLDDKLEDRVSPPLNGRSSPSDDRFRARVRTFFAHPLEIFGRRFRAFCWKDGAAVYWCESGSGIETIPLVDFAQRYLQVELNGSMSVAKYAARFELGLTTTTPTVTFARNEVLRTPDLNSASLMISEAAMRAVCDEFWRKRPGQAGELLPGSYLPSCIRGTVQQHPGAPSVDMVWRLDYSILSPSPRPARSTASIGTSSSSSASDPCIQLRPFPSEPSAPSRPVLRFSLDAKDGTRTRVVAPEGLRVEWVEDGRRAESGEEEVVMTDGCSLMSLAAMRELSAKYAESRRDSDLKPTTPCIAQGRVGLGKGVWAADHVSPWTDDKWIEIRDSQWKAKDGQTDLFTFELHSVPSSKGGAKLGKQMFEVLAHCGVPPSVFTAMLRSQVELSQDAFWNAPSTAALLYHVEKSCGVLEDRTLKARMAADPRSLRLVASESSSASLLDGRAGEDALAAAAAAAGRQREDSGEFVHDGRLDPSSGAPNVVAEVVVEMLQAGFDPHDNPHLADKLHRVAKSCVQKQIGFRIDDEWSRTAFVIADHLGVLEEGEFHFQVTEALPAPRGAGCVRIIDGLALLSRSPAVQPCDIQRAMGVFRPEYAAFHDVVIVSTKGARSLCSILSGGDHDGDKLLVMTHPDLVHSFDPARADPSFADPPFADSDWFDIDSRKVSDVVQPLIASGDNAALASIFMEGLFLGTQFGMLSTFHTTLAYQLGLDHALTREAGHLFCKALDGRKQGLSFSPEKWARAKAKFAHEHPHKPEWTFCEDGKDPPLNGPFAKRPRALGRHPMDELVKAGKRLLASADLHWSTWAAERKFQVDEHLAGEWRRAWGAALQDREALAPAGSAYFDDLCLIRDHVRAIFVEYKALFQSWGRESDRRKYSDSCAGAVGSPTKSPSRRKGWSASSKSQKDELRELSARFWAILGGEGTGAFRSRELQGEVGRRTARALLASCAYLDPLEPTPEPPAVGVKTLLNRMQNCAPGCTRYPGLATSSSLVAQSSVVLAAAEIVVTTPAAEDEDMGEESFGDDLAWSQVPEDLTQTALTSLGATSSTGSSQTGAATVLASSNPSAAPLSPIKGPSEPPTTSARFQNTGRPFSEVAGKSAIRFPFDLAHRDMLGLEADGLARTLHGRHAGAGGIQASKIAPHILDVLQVSKRCAGITSSRAKVRPRTLLSPGDEVDAVASPAKKARRM